MPIHREEAASKRWSECAKLEYQKVRRSAAVGAPAPPGLMNRAITIMPMMRTPTIVAGSAMLELEASVADASGREADCELLPADPFPGAVIGNVAFPELGTSGVTLVGTVVLGATAFCVPTTAAWVVSLADFKAEVLGFEAKILSVVAGCAAVVSGMCLRGTVVEAESPVDVDAIEVELGLAVSGVAGTDVAALADGEETGAGPTGDDVVVVDVWIGSGGDVRAVALRFVVPGVAEPDVGVLADGEETGAGPTGDDVGVVDVWVGFIGDATGVGGPEGGAEVGCGGEAGVGMGVGG